MIYLLQQIAGDTSTPSELAEKAACLCIPDAKQREAVMTYLLCLAAGGTAPPADCVMLSGVGNPTDVTTPDFVGQLYHDTDADTYYYSTGLTSADWTVISGGATAANVQGAGDPT